MAIKPSGGIQRASPLDSNMYENRKNAYKRQDEEKEESGQERQSPRDRAEFGADRKGKKIRISKDALALLIPARQSNVKIAKQIHQLREAVADLLAPSPQAPSQKVIAPPKNTPRTQNLSYFRPSGKKGAADIKA